MRNGEGCKHPRVRPDLDAYVCITCGTRIYALKSSNRIAETKAQAVTAQQWYGFARRLERERLRAFGVSLSAMSIAAAANGYIYCGCAVCDARASAAAHVST